MPDTTVLLMGQPNVGKSVLFSQLTGMHIMVSNYAGTTVEYTAGRMALNGQTVQLIDVPGTYGLQATNEAEQVAVSLLMQSPSAVLCVLDAFGLESSLHLLMEVLEYGLPTIAVLNRLDLAEKHGMQIDHQQLQRELGIPVVPTVAVENKGLDGVRRALVRIIESAGDAVAPAAVCAGCHVHHGGNGNGSSCGCGIAGLLAKKAPIGSVAAERPPEDTADQAERWARTEALAAAVMREPAGNEAAVPDPLVQPWPGIPIATGIVGLMFALVIGLGMGLRRFVLMPLFRSLLFPLIVGAVQAVVPAGLLQNILIGEYGFLIKGLEWPFALVLPYVISFYLGLSVLEDWGYLPRLAVLLDGLLNKIGLNGSAIIPLLLGYGCGIPAIMASRSLSSRKQRLMISAMVCLAVPCVSQTGAFIALLSERSLAAVAFVFAVSIVTMIVAGLVLDRMDDEAAPLTLMEVPPLLAPRPAVLGKKVMMRVRHYILDGALPMAIAVLFAALLYETGVLAVAGQAMAPLISGWLDLPSEAVVPLILGIVRRELTVLPLIDMNLTTLQFMTGALVALLYVPCIAMVATLAKEFGVKVAATIFVATTFAALFFGGLLAQMGNLLVGWLA